MAFVMKLPICYTLDPATVFSINKICVFRLNDSDDKSCIYIDEEDNVYSMGGNIYGCLGLGDERSRAEPVAITQLCKQHVKSIAFGRCGHMLAVTECGRLFSWGYNEVGQVGNGNCNNVLIPVRVTTNFQDKKIVQAVCGSLHSMALSDEGEIFAWGCNDYGQLGSVSTENQSSPQRVNLEKAVSIACGWHSVALLGNGEVYGWGFNGFGELGLDNRDNQPIPCKVERLSGVVIKQIVCGCYHTLALSEDGCVFSWGRNAEGQLGTGDTTSLLSPHKIPSEERFIEIGACHCSNTSAGLTMAGKVFMWGECDGQYITSPLLTEASTTDEIFVLFSYWKTSWRMYSVVWPNVDANPLDIHVRKCIDGDPGMTERFGNTEEVYSMKFRTVCVRVLIINNKTFQGTALDTRKPLTDRPGTDIDAEALDILFRQLGYKLVETKTDLTGKEILSALEKEAEYSRKTDNAFICVIMSHGTSGSVYGVDGQPIKLHDIYNQFNGQKCPKLVGKPKIFFIQACQGEQMDAAGGVEQTDGAMELNKELAGLKMEEEQADCAVPVMSDILVSTATTEGYVSWRHPEKGSWFIQALVHVIQKYAYKYDLLQILTKTNALIAKQTTSTSGYKQSAEKRDTFRKQFYFFPGFDEK